MRLKDMKHMEKINNGLILTNIIIHTTANLIIISEIKTKLADTQWYIPQCKNRFKYDILNTHKLDHVILAFDKFPLLSLDGATGYLINLTCYDMIQFNTLFWHRPWKVTNVCVVGLKTIWFQNRTVIYYIFQLVDISWKFCQSKDVMHRISSGCFGRRTWHTISWIDRRQTKMPFTNWTVPIGVLSITYAPPAWFPGGGAGRAGIAAYGNSAGGWQIATKIESRICNDSSWWGFRNSWCATAYLWQVFMKETNQVEQMSFKHNFLLYLLDWKRIWLLSHAIPSRTSVCFHCWIHSERMMHQLLCNCSKVVWRPMPRFLDWRQSKNKVVIDYTEAFDCAEYVINRYLFSDRDLIGVQPDTQRLTFLASTSDFEETVRLSERLLHRYGNFTMHSRLVDSHIYVIKKWVIDYLKQVSHRRLT